MFHEHRRTVGIQKQDLGRQLKLLIVAHPEIITVNLLIYCFPLSTSSLPLTCIRNTKI